MQKRNLLSALFAGITQQPAPVNQPPGWFTMRSSGKRGTIDLYGIVGYGISRDQFARELKALGDIETLTVNLASIGGDFDNGLPIYNILKNHPAKVTVNVMGYALSMGSMIMLAGDVVNIAQNGLVMIHRTQSYSYGDADQLRKDAGIADKHDAAIRPLYAARMGMTEDNVQKLLAAETWYTAQEAQAAGLVDAIIDPVDLSAIDAGMPENAWRMAGNSFSRPPAALKQKLSLVNNTADLPRKIPTDEDDAMTKEEIEELKTAITESMQVGFQGMTAQLKETMQAPPAKPPAEAAEEVTENKVLVALESLKSQVTAMQQQHDELKTKLETLEQTPVNRKPKPEHGSDPDNGGKQDPKGHYS